MARHRPAGSHLGRDGLALVALASRVYQGSHAWAVAAVFLAVTIPITALAPVAGLLLDRLPARPVYSGVLFGRASAGMAAAGGLLSSLNPRVVLLLAGWGGLAAAGAVGWLIYVRRHPRDRPAGARPASPPPPPQR